ncbi:MAG: hypothetical protein U0790_08110 [Isosphaeraceae bacterium]
MLLAAPLAAPAQQPEPEPAKRAGVVQALSARYHFAEKYGVAGVPTQPELLTQYRVAARETTKISREKAEGAPQVDQSVLQSIYAERVARVNKDGFVGEVVRRYEQAKLNSTVRFTSYKTKWLEGLTVLYRLQNRLSPQILSLSDRSLRQQEYEQISLQPFLPVLATMLPRTPSRVGDTWQLTRASLWALVGEMPLEEGFEVTAELREVRNDDPGKPMMAVIDVRGDFQLAEGSSAVNAQISFTFQPSAARARGRAAPGAGSQDQPGTAKSEADAGSGATYEARGYVSKIRMAQVISMTAPGDGARLKQTIDRSLILERRTSSPDDGAQPPLAIPDPAPAPSVANSWLLYDDPQGRFHLLYPQEFRVAKVYPDGGIDLLDPRPDGQDVIQVNPVPKGPEAQRDRLPADPQQEKKLLEEDWRKRGEKVLPGPAGWLPEADWSASKRRVYRIEAALVPDEDSGRGPVPAGGRIYMDRYIVQFLRNEVIRVTAMTTRDPHVAFRDQAESLIRTFEFGPSPGAVPAARAEPGGSGPGPGR